MKGSQKAVRTFLVDDDDTFRRVMSAELTRRGYTVATAASGSSALSSVLELEPDVILLDLWLPDMDGIVVLKKLREMEIPAGVVVLTGHGTIDTAIQAIRLGAVDYLEKPCPLDKVDMVIQKTYEHQQLIERKKVLEDGYSRPVVDLQFVGKSQAFSRMTETIARIAPTDSTTLILGETGVGKEMVARLLHARSRRSDKPFVVVDCAALQESLLHSELFGHEKGAFTGATRLKHGLFEVASGGTIFLDEVGDTSHEIQAKLLRVLETGRFRRLGGTRETVVDVRVISATNRNLREAITRGHFREDLYFRLTPLTIEIPPLRDRPEDIRALVEHFNREFNRRFSRSTHFSSAAMEVLLRYNWPGNVRELIHTVEQVMVFCDKCEVGPEDLPWAIGAGVAERSASSNGQMLPLREVTKRYVLSVMQREGASRARAARILQISERHLYRLLKKYSCQPTSPSETDKRSAH